MTAGPVAATPPWLAVGPANAPAIVFLHGTRLTRAQWLPQVRRLSDRFRCIAVDLPGHGARAGEPFTMAGASDAVVAAIEAEAPAGRAVIVGLSLGGYVAIETAERCPERVAGLVLAGCSAEPVGPVAAVFRGFAWGLEHAQKGGLGVVNGGFFRVRYGARIADPIIAGGFWPVGGAQALRVVLAHPLRRAPRPPLDAGPGRQRRPRPGVRARRRPVGGRLPARPPRHPRRARCTSPTSTVPGRSPTSSPRSPRTPPAPPEATVGAASRLPAGRESTGPPVYCRAALPLPREVRCASAKLSSRPPAGAPVSCPPPRRSPRRCCLSSTSR